jgi:signal transduction histidine kinase
MRFNALWRTTTFRLTALYGVVFALGAFALLGIIYVQSTGFLTRRVDGILNTQAEALRQAPPEALDRRINYALTLNGERTGVFALFSPNGARLAGNLDVMPAGLRVGGAPIESAPSRAFPANARLIARALPTGNVLVVGRDVNQLQEMRAIIASALAWSGLSILAFGVVSGVALSIRPLRRLRVLQAVGQDIASGDLKRRMPVSRRHDELDMLAATVNHMMGEVERLMNEVKGSTETIAHDLLRPLTRASTRLHRMTQIGALDLAEIDRVAVEIDDVLSRFRAILRITELEARQRRAGFSPVDLADVVGAVAELYQPLAESRSVSLRAVATSGIVVEADLKLLVEAVSNLVDNAIKFSGGGMVDVHLGADSDQPCIIVRDSGLGIPAHERTAVLQRFYRGERHRLTEGSGLGLSIVAAVVRLHGFELALEDANPGLRVVIACQKPSLSY